MNNSHNKNKRNNLVRTNKIWVASRKTTQVQRALLKANAKKRNKNTQWTVNPTERRYMSPLDE